MLKEILKDIDRLIDFINTLEDETLAKMNLPPRDDCIFSLCMMKEKHIAMQVMEEEFYKASK